MGRWREVLYCKSGDGLRVYQSSLLKLVHVRLVKVLKYVHDVRVDFHQVGEQLREL